MSLAIGPAARLRMHGLYEMINHRVSWYEHPYLSELTFWQQQISNLSGHPIWFSSGATRVAYSDATDSGFGVCVVELGNDITQRQWSALEAQQSSTWRELKAVDQVLHALGDKLAGHTVKWLMDNQIVVGSFKSLGSKKPRLQDGAMSIFEICLAKSIKLELAWIPRTLNDSADYISRL